MANTSKLSFTEETDFVVLNYDQSDIEEIEENEENLGHSETNILSSSFNQLGDVLLPNLSQKDNLSEDDGENGSKADPELENQRLEKHERILGNQSEGLSNESDIEMVGSSTDTIDQEFKLIKEENGLYDEFDDEDMEEIPVVYFISEDENGVPLEHEIMDLRKIKRPRSYRHTPNSLINLRLNLMVCFAITAGIFLGWGNYLGWSANWTKTKAMMTINNNHIAKLKSLQDELVACMNLQSKGTQQTSSKDLKVCHQNGDYWKEKMDTLFRENKGLKDILEETQKHYWTTGHHKDIFDSKDCSSGTVADEFHKLKLDLLVKQMEHLQVLKTFEEVKYQEKLSREKLKTLEEENIELKAKLVEEEEDDKIISSTLEGRIKQLELENSKLKQRLSRQRASNDDLESGSQFNKDFQTSSHDNSSEIIRSYEEKIQELRDENIEFKKTLQQLLVQVELMSSPSIPDLKSESEKDSATSDANFDELQSENTESLKIDSLRQHINSMAQENDDLYHQIARLRWSRKPVQNEEENGSIEEREEKEEMEREVDTKVVQREKEREKEKRKERESEEKKQLEKEKKWRHLATEKERETKYKNDKERCKRQEKGKRFEKVEGQKCEEMEIKYSYGAFNEDNSLKTQIHDLQKLLSSERDESSKWKTMFEELQTELNSNMNQKPIWAQKTEDTNESEETLSTNNYSDNADDINGGDSDESNERFYDWLGDTDLAKLLGDGFSSGSRMVVDAMRMVVEKAVEAQASIPESIQQKINSTMSTLDNLQKKMWQRWVEVRRFEVLTPDSQDHKQVLNEMTDLLITSLRKLQEVGTKFGTNLKPIPQKIDKLTGKMSKILENLENKWRKNREKLFKIGFNDDFKWDDLKISDLEEAENWFIQRAESRRSEERTYPMKENDKRSWLFKRARDRAALRVKGDTGRTRGL